MNILERSRRVWCLDLARGVFIFTMLTAHAIFFFHHSINPLLQVIGGLGDFISFTGTLMIAGATAYLAYLNPHQSFKTDFIRSSKRLFIYLLSYYVLSLFIASHLEGWSLSLPWEIISFQKLVPFTEFIIPFLVLGFLKFPLRPLYRYIAAFPIIGLVIGGVSFFLGNLLSGINPAIPMTWKAIWVWHTGTFSFPIFQYFPVYLLGIYIGKYVATLKRDHFTLLLWQLVQSGFLLCLVIYFSGIAWGKTHFDLVSRWPPSVLFILSSGVVCLSLILLIIKSLNLAAYPWTRAFLLILGQNAFALFITHTALLYGYKASNLPQAYSAVLVIVLWLVSLGAALSLAKIIPLNYRFALTFISWCECRLGFCIHTREPWWILSFKRAILKVMSLSRSVSFRVGKRQVQPLRSRNVAVALSLFLVIATPVGLLENQILLQNQPVIINGSLNRTWFLATDASPTLIYTLDIPTSPVKNEASTVQVYIDSQPVKPASVSANLHSYAVVPSTIKPGTHEIYAQVDIHHTSYTTAKTIFQVSYPLFISWTADWEGYDVSDHQLEAVSTLAAEYHVPVTHLFNPRIFTDPRFSPARADFLSKWVKERRDHFNEEIGLHLHMFPDFVKAAGLEPKTEPVWGGGVSPGYDILTTSYSYDEMRSILKYAKDLFNQKGLGQPVSFRAGAWFANIETLKALQDEGFLIDSSGRTKYEFGTNHVVGFWDLSPLTRPYFPSLVNQNDHFPPPNLRILEIPNNGADDYAFSGEEMVERFQLNFNGQPLGASQQVTYLTHPQWLNQRRIDANRLVFETISQYRYDTDNGPVVLATLKEIYRQLVN